MGEAKRRRLGDARPTADAARAELMDKILDCHGCTACCRNMRIEVSPREAQGLDTVLMGRQGMSISTRTLRQSDNGDCIYLAQKGCEIYERRPAMCRVFHCVALTQEAFLVSGSASPAMRDACVRRWALAEQAGVPRAELTREIRRRGGGRDQTTVRLKDVGEDRRVNFLADMMFGVGGRGDDTKT